MSILSNPWFWAVNVLFAFNVAQFLVWKEMRQTLKGEREKFAKEYDATIDIRFARIYGEMTSLLQTYDEVLARAARTGHEADAAEDIGQLREAVLLWREPLQAYIRDHCMGRGEFARQFPAPYPIPGEVPS